MQHAQASNTPEPSWWLPKTDPVSGWAITAIVCGALVVGLIIVIILSSSPEQATQSPTAVPSAPAPAVPNVQEQVSAPEPPPSPRLISASGNIWIGVKIYTVSGGYVGTVTGVDNHCYDPMTGRTFDGVEIEYPDGAREWKERSGVRSWGYVMSDDPAITN